MQVKFRRKVFFEQNREEIGKNLRELCNWKGVTIIQAEVCPDHIHMLVEIPPKMSVSGFVGFLKGKSSLILLGITNTSMAIGASGVGDIMLTRPAKNTKKIAEYIANQLKEDQIADQMTMKEYTDPFKGDNK